ncbi:MAG: hypothetical protein ACRD3K_15260, partial [Edaphobacter sp.]
MRATLHFRASAISRYATAFALCSFSLHALGQTPTPTDKTPAVSKTVETIAGAPAKHKMQAAEDAYLAGARMVDHNDLTGAEILLNKAT